MTSAVILAVILPFLTGLFCCLMEEPEPSRPIELQGVGCDLWIIYPTELEMLDDEEVRI